jgi:integrase
LRAPELRGLRWPNVDLAKREIHVRERADEYNELGRPKSGSGERTIPVPPIVVNTLREWKLKCPKTELNLVFPSPIGTGIVGLQYIVRRGLWPAQIVAKIIKVGKDSNGKVANVGEIPGPPRTSPFLCKLVHQQKG